VPEYVRHFVHHADIKFAQTFLEYLLTRFQVSVLTRRRIKYK